MLCHSRKELVEEAHRIALTSDDLFQDGTIANLNSLLSSGLIEPLMPVLLGRGYWPTYSLEWSGLELEVFEDRIEVYRFHPDRMDIWYEDHLPDKQFSDRFITELNNLRLRLAQEN